MLQLFRAPGGLKWLPCHRPSFVYGVVTAVVQPCALVQCEMVPLVCAGLTRLERRPACAGGEMDARAFQEIFESRRVTRRLMTNLSDSFASSGWSMLINSQTRPTQVPRPMDRRGERISNHLSLLLMLPFMAHGTLGPADGIRDGTAGAG